jgi:hypothetical protein
MPRRSLLAGRHKAPLTAQETLRASNTFLGLDSSVNARYSADEVTSFRVTVTDQDEVYGEIVFGPDIYPGTSLVDPNSALGLEAAAAHELTHYHRWHDKTALDDEAHVHLDEALTSLQAILRYQQLSSTSKAQLVSDALHRLHLYIDGLKPDEKATAT